MIQRSKLLLSFLLLFCPMLVMSQAKSASEADLRKQAEKHFAAGNYELSLPAYSRLLSLYPNDANYNYRFGVSQLMAGKEKSNAASYLEIASASKTVSDDVWYYLGLGHLVNSDFNKARDAFRQFKLVASESKKKKFDIDNLLRNCENGMQMSKSRRSVIILNSKEVHHSGFYNSYDFNESTGKVVAGADQFYTSQDKEKQKEPAMYIGNDKQSVFIASHGKKGNRSSDIYSVRKSPAGLWLEPENLGDAVNSTADEDYPYLDRDGRTLYFSSKGHNSIGGYDIFKTVYDFNTRTWSEPVSLGIPINTVGDDILFVPGEDNTATYATTAESGKNNLNIRKIQLPSGTDVMNTISGVYIPVDQKVRRDARITILTGTGDGIVTSVYTDPRTGKYELVLPPGNHYMIVVEGGGYLPHAEYFELPAGMRNPVLKQVVKVNREDQKEELTLQNYFSSGVIAAEPTNSITRSYSASLDSSKMMSVKINDQVIKVTPPSIVSVDASSKIAKPVTEKVESVSATPDSNGLVASADHIEIISAEQEEDTAVLTEDAEKFDANISNADLARIAYEEVESLKIESDSLRKEAGEIRKRSGQLESHAYKLKEEAQMDSTESDSLLLQAEALQYEADELNAESDRLETLAAEKDAESNSALAEAKSLFRGTKISENKSAKESSTIGKGLESADKQSAIAMQQSDEEQVSDASTNVSVEGGTTDVTITEIPATTESSNSSNVIGDEAVAGAQLVNDKREDIPVKEEPSENKSAINESPVASSEISSGELTDISEDITSSEDSEKKPEERVVRNYNALKSSDYPMLANKQEAESPKVDDGKPAMVILNDNSIVQLSEVDTNAHRFTASDENAIKQSTKDNYSQVPELRAESSSVEAMSKKEVSITSGNEFNDPADQSGLLPLKEITLAAIPEKEISVENAGNDIPAAESTTMNTDTVIETALPIAKASDTSMQEISRAEAWKDETVQPPVSESSTSIAETNGISSERAIEDSVAQNEVAGELVAGGSAENSESNEPSVASTISENSIKSTVAENDFKGDSLSENIQSSEIKSDEVNASTESVIVADKIDSDNSVTSITVASDTNKNDFPVVSTKNDDSAEKVVVADLPEGKNEKSNEQPAVPVKENARVAYEEFRSGMKQSESLSDESGRLQAQVESMQNSPLRDSLILAANELSLQSVKEWQKAQMKATEARAIDPSIDSKMNPVGPESTQFTEDYVAIENMPVDTQHADYSAYREKRGAITGKQAETIHVFAEAINLNRKASELKAQEYSLRDSSILVSDESKKSALNARADELKMEAEKADSESREKFKIARENTSEVKNLRSELTTMKKKMEEPVPVAQASNQPVAATASSSVLRRDPRSWKLSSGGGVAVFENENNKTMNAQTFAMNERGSGELNASESEIKAVAVSKSDKDRFSAENFNVKSGNTYTTLNPVPMDPSLPDGLVFKVQVGAFRKPLPEGTLGGLEPLTGETTRPGWIRYCVGLFRTFEPANIAKGAIRKNGYKDAFVVAYFNGKRISLNEAYMQLKRMESTMAYKNESAREMALLHSMNIRQDANYNASEDNDVLAFYANQSGTVERGTETVTETETETETETVIGKNDLGVVPASVSEYAVQVGVYTTSRPPSGIASLDHLQAEEIRKGLFRFISGRYVSYADANKARIDIAGAGVKDAFVVRYREAEKVKIEKREPAKRIAAAKAPERKVNETANQKEEAVSTVSLPIIATADSAAPGEVIFKIQVGAFSNNVPYKTIENFVQIADKGISRLNDESGNHVFYAGSTKDYKSAVILKDEVRKVVKDAFIVALKDGKRIPITEEMVRE